MNSLHGIHLQNSEVAARGQTLVYNKRTKQLAIKGGDPLTPVFLNRRQATEWAKKHHAMIATV